MKPLKDKDDEFTIDLSEYTGDDGIIIDLSDTYGTTTTYFSGDTVTDTVSTIDIGDYNLSGNFGSIDFDSWRAISPDEVEKMCKEYPALEKVWRNFKSVYDMVKQDYEGKKKAGEIDDDLPF